MAAADVPDRSTQDGWELLHQVEVDLRFASLLQRQI
jgi:hypothetical protein